MNELNSTSTLTNTQASWSDPLLCPNDVVTATGSQVRDCNIQFNTQFGGNKALQPEESKTFNYGVVYEPLKNLVLTADYFNIEIQNKIGFIAESAIFKNPEKYSALYTRNEDQSLAFINQQYMNLGKTQTTGFDLSAQWRSSMTQYGRFAMSIDGTYIDTYKFQTEKNGEWHSAVGRYDMEFGSVITRWKHNANLNWNAGPWNINLQQTFFKGYQDQNSDEQNHHVKDYTLQLIQYLYRI